MTQHDVEVALRHMYDHAAEAAALADGRIREDLDTDRLFALALTRLVEIIGEAARRVPEKIRADHPEIPWREIVGTRNRLVHGYDAVDHDILWKIAAEELPLLSERLRTIIEEL